MRVVLDTNVLVSALRSNQGASFAIISRLGDGSFTPVVSATLFFEYESVLMRTGMLPGLSKHDIADFLDYFASVAQEQRIHFLWRPLLHDPADDMVAEVAFCGEVDDLITHNIADFRNVAPLGIRVTTPGDFLKKLSSP